MTDAMRGALVAVRLVQFASAMLLLGAPALMLALLRRLPERERREFVSAARRMLLAAALVALVSAALWLDLEAAVMGDGWALALDPGTLGTVLRSTEFGTAWQWHLALGAAVFAALLLRSPHTLPWVVVLAAAFVASLAWAGHAVMAQEPSHVAVMAVHLLAGGFWLGSLPVLYRALRLARRSDGVAEALRSLLPIYSRAGYAAVAFVLLTGIANTAFLVGSAGALVASVYGRVLLLKIALVLVLIGIAAANRFRWAPHWQAGDARALRALVRSVAAEQGAAFLVLAAVSVLGTLPPALRP